MKVNDSFAYLTLLSEHIQLPKKVRKEIIDLLGNIEGKTVLEYGCNVGTLTVLLTKAVGSYGMIIATDLSKKGLSITQKRIEKNIAKSEHNVHGKVHMLHDEKHTTRVHPEISYVDAVVSVGMVSYVQDIKKVLKEMDDILPDGGQICIVEYVDYFKFVPNVEWLSNNKSIQALFAECGFSVRVIRRNELFWNYVYIYGIKQTGDIVAYI